MAAATRFRLTSGGAAAVSPAFDAGWEQTGQADRVRLLPKLLDAAITALANSTTMTVPITTTQDILCRQFVGDPLRAQTISGTISAVIRVFESATTANVTLALLAKVVSQDGGTARGTIFSTFNTDTEWPLSASAATRIVNAQALSSLAIQAGDRLVIEIGGHAAGPTAATSYNMRFGNSAASDFALTTALTTDLNPWVELSKDLFGTQVVNYQCVRAESGISVTETLR